MGFLRRISNLFSAPAARPDNAYWVTVQCSKCGEIIRSRINMMNDPSINYGDSDKDTTYFVRKTIIGEQRCYQPVEIELTFDAHKKLIERKIRGGKFVDEEA